MTRHTTADLPQSGSGRQYHIGVGPGELAPTILLCGDPQRAHRMAGYFTDCASPRTNREYVTITGRYHGLSCSVMATGMGPDNTEIALVEIAQLVTRPILIRVGTSGGLLDTISIGDLVISTGAVRYENTSTAFVPEGYPAVAHHDVTLALMESATRRKARFHLGLTATGAGFYGAQGRDIPQFPSRYATRLDELARLGVCNFEMEASCLFTLATLMQARAGCVCGVIAQRNANAWVDEATKARLEQETIEVALEAVEILARMDAHRAAAPHWLPSMGC
ncbi:MAG: nucleoside phosphorylase [Deltaproteobacteria bacterium]|nr:nucleoside phosphorylase [Deltaproteobacteria bacterium]